MRLWIPLAALAAVTLAAYAPSPALAARPPTAPADSSEWTNLQVLPDTISHDALMGIMRGFKAALGVECSFCHVERDGDLQPALDDKGHKEVARGMMRMTWQINTEILPAIEGIGMHGTPEVTCYTCHRGSVHPPARPGDADPHDAHRHAPGSHGGPR